MLVMAGARHQSLIGVANSNIWQDHKHMLADLQKSWPNKNWGRIPKNSKIFPNLPTLSRFSLRGLPRNGISLDGIAA
jgi:hypothetical protein